MKTAEKFFYQTGVDIASPKSMFYFLYNHFKYYVLNPWNALMGFANKVKVHSMYLPMDVSEKVLGLLFDETDKSGLCTVLIDMIDEWERKHPDFKVYFNGHSDGYLVLTSAYNLRSILSDVLNEYVFADDNQPDKAYSELKEFLHRNGAILDDYIYELRAAVQVVRDFDQLCDDMRQTLINITRNYVGS